MDFFESKLIGDEFENKILSEITIKCGLNGKLNDVVEKFKEFDIILSNDIKIECKHDLQFQTTNNFIVETHCNGNESGILTTKADYWILGNLEYIYIFTTENLKKCIAENWGDIHETGYNYASIEETFSGLYPFIEKEHWYEWKGKSKKLGDGKYVPCEKPERLKNVVNFGIG